MEAYLDNSATTRVLPCVKDLMVEVMEVEYGIRLPFIKKEWKRKHRFVWHGNGSPKH